MQGRQKMEGVELALCFSQQRLFRHRWLNGFDVKIKKNVKRKGKAVFFFA
jgi:hypothetical protein